jgi:hypothetical protein
MNFGEAAQNEIMNHGHQIEEVHGKHTQSVSITLSLQRIEAKPCYRSRIENEAVRRDL